MQKRSDCLELMFDTNIKNLYKEKAKRRETILTCLIAGGEIGVLVFTILLAT